MPFSSALTAPAISAFVTRTPTEIAPIAIALAVARAVFCWPIRRASTSTWPVDPSEAVEPTIASVAVADVISAWAYAPAMPTTPMLASRASAFAWLSPVARTRTELVPETTPSALARVAPLTKADESITVMEMPPAVPPGAFAAARLTELASTTREPFVTLLAVDVRCASVLRPAVARATVMPAAMSAPVPRLKVLAVTPLWVPTAVTEMPPDPTGPCAPEAARVWPESVARATAPLMLPPTPACTEKTSARGLLVVVADTVTPPTTPVVIPKPAASLPRATSPMLARAFPVVVMMPIDAPTAATPKPTPIDSTDSLRTAVVVTEIPLPARVSLAPLSMCAFCVLSALTTTTCPPTAMTPATPPKATPRMDEVCLASTVIAPPVPAVSTAPEPTPASARPCTLSTSTDTPTPARPAAMLPARPLRSRSSLARTWMEPPATTVPWTAAAVPSGSGLGCSAVPVGGSVGAAAPIRPVALPDPLRTAPLMRDAVFASPAVAV